MSQAMPEHIKKNFVYRKVWQNVHQKDKNATFMIIGDVGSGKSTAALLFGQELDANFSLERVCFSAEQLFELFEDGDSHGKLPPGSVIVFDEAAGSEEAADSRRSLSHINMILSFFATVSRSRRYVIFYVAPFMSQLDKRLRTLGLTGIFIFHAVDFEAKKSRAAFRWAYSSPLTGKTLMPYPRLKDPVTGEVVLVNELLVPMPSGDLVKAYKAKKEEFIDRKIGEWKAQLSKIRTGITKQVSLKAICNRARKKIDEFTDENGRIDKSLLRVEYNLSDRNAAAVKKILETETAP